MSSEQQAASGEVAIRVNGISKTFKLPHEKQSSLKGLFLSTFRGKKYELQHALKNINFEVKKGEFYGIVGRNGSGKSTLLKLIAGIYTPESGNIEINGILTPFIELGVGFNPELSGRDNVFLNGALFGKSRAEMEELYDEIVDFAELKRFMDQKLKNYSSGMQVRLAFSIAIRAQGDILLLDEVLAVGDAAFQQKCYDYFTTLKRNKQTIILVSHSMPIIESYCDQALLIEHGTVQQIGSSHDIANLYDEMFLKEDLANQRKLRGSKKDVIEKSHDDILRVKKVELYQGAKKTTSLKALQDFDIKLVVTNTEAITEGNIRISIRNRQGLLIADINTSTKLGYFQMGPNSTATFTLRINNIFANGVYTITYSSADTFDDQVRSLNFKRLISEFQVSGIVEAKDSLTHPAIDIRMDIHEG